MKQLVLEFISHKFHVISVLKKKLFFQLSLWKKKLMTSYMKNFLDFNKP